MAEKAKWTFMVYLAGDNNLSTAGEADLAEMRAVGSTADVNIVAQFDNAGDQGTSRYFLGRNGLNEEVISFGETDSGDPQVLLDFFTWAVAKYPAERYGLILWNHGGGWEPAEMDRIAKKVAAPNYSIREASQRSASRLGKTFFRASLEKIFSLPTANERAICSDDGSGHSLDTIELGKVLAEVAKILGRKLHLLGLDACLMSNLEVACQARPYVSYIAASEELEPNEGWPYREILKKLVEHPDLNPQEFAAYIVEAYVQSYQEMHNPGPITHCAMDLSCLNPLVGSLDKLAEALMTHLPAIKMEIWNAQMKSASFFDYTLWDILDFCEALEKFTSVDQVKGAAQGVRATLTAGAGNFVISQAHYGKKVEHCGGVSIYLPAPPPGLSRYYADLDFAQNRWWAFLQAYHAF